MQGFGRDPSASKKAVSVSFDQGIYEIFCLIGLRSRSGWIRDMPKERGPA